MGYSTNPATVERVRKFLEILVVAEEASVFFPSDEPAKLAYRLREAFFAAKTHKGFKTFHDLKETWRVCTSATGVECQRRDAKQKVEPVREAEDLSMTLTDVTALAGVLGAAMRFKPATEIVFPHARLRKEDKLKLPKRTLEYDWQSIDQYD